MVIELLGDVKIKRKREILDDFLQRTGKIPRPPCYRCRGKVPEMAVDLDTERDCITITAICHGEKETLFIPVSKIREIQKIELGWAFLPQSDRSRRKGKPH